MKSTDETIRALKVMRPGRGAYVDADLRGAVDELENHYAEGAVDAEVTFKVVEMTRAEYAALPEFPGW